MIAISIQTRGERLLVVHALGKPAVLIRRQMIGLYLYLLKGIRLHDSYKRSLESSLNGKNRMAKELLNCSRLQLRSSLRECGSKCSAALNLGQTPW